MTLMRSKVRRIIGWSMALFVAAGGAVGCAGTQQTSDEETDVQNRPPEEEAPEELPPGPEVKVRSDYPEKADEGETADGRETTSAEQTDASASEAEVITDAQREQLLELGPGYVFQTVQLEPKRTDGDFVGYEIVGATPKAKEAMTPQIEVGDVVTHVNDIRIERPRDYMKAWNKFGEADRVHIDLLRDGSETKATWVIRSKN